jgi:hypothetical protein
MENTLMIIGLAAGSLGALAIGRIYVISRRIDNRANAYLKKASLKLDKKGISKKFNYAPFIFIHTMDCAE